MSTRMQDHSDDRVMVKCEKYSHKKNNNQKSLSVFGDQKW